MLNIRPTCLGKLSQLDILVEQHVDLREHVRQAGGQDDPAPEAGEGRDEEGGLGALALVLDDKAFEAERRQTHQEGHASQQDHGCDLRPEHLHLRVLRFGVRRFCLCGEQIFL